MGDSVCKSVVLVHVPSFWMWGSRNIKIIALFCQASTAGEDFLEEISVQGNICRNHLGPPTLAFFRFPFLVFRFALLFCAFFLSFPRILGFREVSRRRETPLHFLGFPFFLEGQGQAKKLHHKSHRKISPSGSPGLGRRKWGV